VNKIDSVLALETLFRLTHDLRKNGKIIGFTHGAFDLFHSGNLRFLKDSSKLCDFLIVGVESDQNIPGYKSQNRPVIQENDRVKS